MSNPPFFRPMFAGFAITAGAMLVLPMGAKAQTADVPAVETPSCEAQAPKPRRLGLGKLLAAAQRSGATQLLSGGALGGSRGGLLAGAVARTAAEAAAETQREVPANAAAAACTPTTTTENRKG